MLRRLPRQRHRREHPGRTSHNAVQIGNSFNKEIPICIIKEFIDGDEFA